MPASTYFERSALRLCGLQRLLQQDALVHTVLAQVQLNWRCFPWNHAFVCGLCGQVFFPEALPTLPAAKVEIHRRRLRCFWNPIRLSTGAGLRQRLRGMDCVNAGERAPH